MTQTTVTHSDTDRCQTPMYTGSDLQFPTISLTHTHTDIHTQTEAHSSANTQLA